MSVCRHTHQWSPWNLAHQVYELPFLREALHERTADLFDKVNNSPAGLRTDYHRFLQFGGSTAADFRRFLRGQQLRRIGDGASKDYGRLRLIAKTTFRDE
jgi:hypothetical protein